MLFVGYSSTSTQSSPTNYLHLVCTINHPHPSICDWILDFLTGRPQSVRIRNRTSASIVTNIGTPQGCVLSPILYTLFTITYTILKLADDTAVIGCITGGDEAAYRREVTGLLS